jgi:hypothetical protein
MVPYPVLGDMKKRKRLPMKPFPLFEIRVPRFPLSHPPVLTPKKVATNLPSAASRQKRESSPPRESILFSREKSYHDTII